MIPPPRPYYSQRNTELPFDRYELSLNQLRQLFQAFYSRLAKVGYFQEALGDWCVDRGEIEGTVGDVASFVLLRLRKPLWPFYEAIDGYSEHDIFDLIELLYDCVSKPEPTPGDYHDFNSCGWHYSTFDREPGRELYLKEVNPFLADYGPGYELSVKGEVLHLGESGQRWLLVQPLPELDPENVDARVAAARRQFLRYGASVEDRRNAVRLLADVLEFLRPRLTQVITKKDENDLFNLANNFGIRHHNDAQKADYDRHIWLEWMFYYYLNTIATVVKMLARPMVLEQPTSPDEDDLPF